MSRGTALGGLVGLIVASALYLTLTALGLRAGMTQYHRSTDQLSQLVDEHERALTELQASLDGDDPFSVGQLAELDAQLTR